MVGALGESSSADGINGDQTNNAAGNTCAVYVLSRSLDLDSTWSQQAYVKASNSAGSDQFGDAVSLSADGNALAVGAFGEDSSAVGINGDQTDNAAGGSGAVYLY